MALLISVISGYDIQRWQEMVRKSQLCAGRAVPFSPHSARRPVRPAPRPPHLATTGSGCESAASVHGEAHSPYRLGGDHGGDGGKSTDLQHFVDARNVHGDSCMWIRGMSDSLHVCISWQCPCTQRQQPGCGCDTRAAHVRGVAASLTRTVCSHNKLAQVPAVSGEHSRAARC